MKDDPGDGLLVATVDLVALSVLNDRLGHTFADIVIDAVGRRLPPGASWASGRWEVGGGGDTPLAWAEQLLVAATTEPAATAEFPAPDLMTPWAPSGVRGGDPVYAAVRVSVTDGLTGIAAAHILARHADWSCFAWAEPHPQCGSCGVPLRYLGVAGDAWSTGRHWTCPGCGEAWADRSGGTLRAGR